MYRLQQAENEKADCICRLRQVGESLEDSSEVEAAVAAHQGAEDAAAGAEVTSRDLELKVQSLRAKTKAVDQRMFSGKVTNPKELSNLHEESQYLKRRLTSAEDELLDALIHLEEAEEQLSAAASTLSEARAQKETLTEDLIAKRTRLEEHVLRLDATIGDIRESLSPSDLETYEYTSRRKGSTAVALLSRANVCGVCGVTVPLATAQQVRERGALTTCPSCERILCAEG